MPMAEPAQTTPSTTQVARPGRPNTATGVYVPAMATKIIEWSMRRMTPNERGDQLPR